MSGHTDDQPGSGDAIAAWTPPTYSTERPPSLLKSRDILKDADFPGNFARSGKWFVDISWKLTTSEADQRIPS